MAKELPMKNHRKAASKALLLSSLHAPVWAHDGHGLFGSHWHATDAIGFIVVIVLAIAAWAIGQRK
jgi:hypothetical protein